MPTLAVSDIPGIIPADSLTHDTRTQEWSFKALSGRLIELSSMDASAILTAATGLVVDAQRQGEPVAWVTTEKSCAYPPDLSEQGVDLDALVVIRVPVTNDIPRAAEKLARSGAFGLIVLDLGADAEIPTPLLARLMQLARKHSAVVMCLTEKSADVSSLSSLVSLRGEARRVRSSRGWHTFEVRILKDKRGSPSWTHTEHCRGPLGLR